MEEQVTPQLDTKRLEAFGQRMKSQFEDYQKDRKSLELQWLKNMRQFRGIIDPEIKKRMTEDQSKAYPKVTRTKVINTVARLMEMLFPNTMKNWKIAPGPVPDLAKEDIDTVIKNLEAELGEGEELTSEAIEDGIMEFAVKRAKEMEREMDDQLADNKYVQLVRRVVFSGVLYSAGVLKGPMVKTVKSRTWRRNLEGKYEAVESKKRIPYYDNVAIWDHYPDLSAKTLANKDGDFQRHIMNRAGVKALMDRPDFLKDQIKTWLNNHPKGNWQEQHWEIELRSDGDRNNVTDMSGRKYELIEWWGMVSADDLRAAGVTLPADDNSTMFNANVWILDNTVIKTVLAPMGDKSIYHTFIYEEDDINLLGIGLPQVVRDSQLGICEAVRMALDNASVVTGPMLEVDSDRLVPGQDSSIHAYKIFWTENNGGQTKPAVREISVNSHLPELTALVDMFMTFADMETALPPPAMGDVTQGGSEALRTTRGASMLLGAASLPIRDTVRNFDQFTESVIGSLYDWNMEFNEKEGIKGDFNISALGSTSLIAKEVRAQALNMFRASVSEAEQVYIDEQKMLVERMEANDVPKDILVGPKEVARRKAAQAEDIAEQKQMQSERIAAETRKILTAAFKDMALANKADASISTDAVEVLLKGLEGAIRASADEQTGREGAGG